MKMFKNIMMVLILLVAGAAVVHAQTMIIAEPFEGGTNLNFGVVENNENVTRGVRISVVYNQTTVPYNVTYQVATPFTNAAGTALAPGALTFQTLSGSATGPGTLYHTIEGPLQSGAVGIFSSANPPATQLSFDILYTAHGSQVTAPGVYHGVIYYQVLAVDGSRKASVFLDVYIDFQFDLNVTVTGSTAPDLVHMTYPPFSGTNAVTINFNGNITGQPVVVKQRITSYPASTSQQYLAIDAVKFRTSFPTGGTGNYPNPTVPTISPQTIYTSSAYSGSVLSVFEFFDASIQGQTAGLYTTTLVYDVEWAGNVYTFNIQLEIEILPTFMLRVTPNANVQMYGNAFSFGQGLTALSGNRDIVLNVDVITNMGQPYRITYVMQSGLMNQANAQPLIPNNIAASNSLQQFKWEKVSGQPGAIAPFYDLNFRPAVVGTFGAPITIFNSLPSGAASKMRVTYRLALNSATTGIPGGAYLTSFVLTLIPN